ncbi:alpha-E domain-containing protein [Croceibacterium aestuarii]|uniref:alpha-E domain-containing protein n=1 Tax=Croceibacterium aestuarii TaxID=3064139 RepID=UPI00272EC4C7|nr:alpha-E domain-containing protein [Croceibacterium sp. D39]
MLGRTANNIFWMFRYLERAENTARLLEAAHRISMTRGGDAASEEWKSVIATLGFRPAYQAVFPDYSAAHVCDFVLRGKGNAESVMWMFETARTNARLCRSAITGEVWEAVNEGWMTLHDLLARPVRESNLGTALAAIRRESTLARGATHGSMIRDEVYSFARLGTFVERGDNTARILDMKYYVLLPSISYVGTALDTGQWEHVLRALSGERAYRWLNAGRMDARSITNFVILDERFPRSLAFCFDQLRENLASLALLHGGEGEANVLIRDADQTLSQRSIDDIFDQGLHQFLLEFISTNRLIAEKIGQDFRFID